MATNTTNTDGADLLLSVPACQVLSVNGGAVERIAGGELQLLQSGSMVFLACGTAFGYPLVNQPVLKSEERVFILPAEAGRHYVVYVANDVASTTVEQFEEALSATTQLRAHAAPPSAAAPEPAAAVSAPATPTPTTPSAAAASSASSSAIVPASSASSSTALARPSPQASPPAFSAAGVGAALSTAILFTGKVAATALVTGAELAGKGVSGTARQMKKIFKPAQAGTNVRPETIARLEQAKVVSRMAVTVSAGLVTGAATLAKSLAVALSDAVMSTEVGDKIKKNGETETGKAVKQVANSSLAAFAEVWDSMEKAALVFGEKAGPGVLEFAEHRYGREGAEVTKQSLSVAHNVTQSALNMRNLGVGGMVRKTAAETAKNVLLRDETTHGTMEIAPVPQRLLADVAPAPAPAQAVDAHAYTPSFVPIAPSTSSVVPASVVAAQAASVPVAAAPVSGAGAVPVPAAQQEFNAFL